MRLGLESIAWWPTVVVLAVATVTDMRSRRIPNWLTLPFLVAGFFASAWVGGWHGVGQSLAGFALATVVYGFLHFMGGMGMGDVKLCAAVGVWIGPSQTLMALVITAMVGGVMAFGWAIVGGFVGELFNGSGELLFGMRKRGLSPHPELVLSNPLTRKMPYAPAIAIGTLISFFSHR
jgi:prepilin peptidase CpaA